MANFAEIDSDNKVTRVIIFSNDDINSHGGDLSQQAIDEFVGLTPHLTAEESPTGKAGVAWVQTSYNKNFRGTFAGVNSIYDSEKDIFIQPCPFPSWTLQSNGTWQSPAGPEPDNPLVNDQKEYSQWWDEENQRWLRYRIADSTPRQNYVWNVSNSTWEEINLDG